MYNYERQTELEELGYEGLLLEGILGSTSEERRSMKPRNPNKDLKKLRRLHCRYKVNLSSIFSEQKSESETVYSVVPGSFDKILDNLAQITSLYPNRQNINLKVIGGKVFEGEGSLKKIRSYLIFIHETVKELFWRTLLVEDCIKRLKGHRNKQGQIYQDIEMILELYSVPEALELFLEDRFPDSVSLGQMKKWCYSNILSRLSFSLIDSPQYIESKIRRKGYNDKGYRPQYQNTKSSEGQDSWRYQFIYNPDLINKEGELIMNEQEQTLQEYLVELQTQSTERFLEYLKELQRKRRLFEHQTFEEVKTIVEDSDLTSEQKVERILRNERTKTQKPPKYLGKYFTKEGKLREVYTDSSREDKKALGKCRDISIQSKKTIRSRATAQDSDK